MEKKKIIFMGGKPIGYKCLSILADKNVDIIAVIPNNRHGWWEDDVSQLAKQKNIPIINLENALEYDVDFIFSIQFNQILKKDILELPKRGAINLHMAPLPEYRGSNQFSFAIINQEKEFGTTLHYMNEGVDSGDIIAQKRFGIPDDITVKDLYKMTEDASFDLFKETIDSILELNIESISQDKLVDGEKTYFYKRSDIDKVKEIKPNWDLQKIYRYVRALDFPPFEPPYFKFEDKKIYLTIDYFRGGKE